MDESFETGESLLRSFFPSLSEEELKAKQAFLDSYCAIAYQILERLEKDRKSEH